MLPRMLRCEECGCVSGAAKGWLAFLVDLLDDDDPPQVATYCPPAPTANYGPSTTRPATTERLTMPQP
jgi:hypothetical protein